MQHSSSLKETKIWQIYKGKLNGDTVRSNWVEKVYNNAAEYLKTVRDTFPNYTLHDEKHILNVLDAMGGLLGSYADNLTVGEAELLILAASLHDIGMCYNDEEKEHYFADNKKCDRFIKNHKPELIGAESKEWDDDVKQNYLRWLHPFRVGEVLNKSEWKKVFDERPSSASVVPENVIISVCQAHGEYPDKIREHRVNDRKLEYQSFHQTDPLFCAILLRLGDILDFDDTRAPQILYEYAGNSDKSR